jgi:hypothetical protein
MNIWDLLTGGQSVSFSDSLKILQAFRVFSELFKRFSTSGSSARILIMMNYKWSTF